MRIYRASELGGCTKRLIAKQLGYDPLPVPGFTQGVMDEGNLHEADVVDRLNQEGTVYDQQKEVNLIVTPEALVQGHIDGKYVFDLNPQATGHKLIEIKSVSQQVWDDFKQRRWEAGYFPKYKWQLSVYMLATKMEAQVVIKNRNTGEIRYEGVEIPFYDLTRITERIQAIEDWVQKGMLPGPCDTPSFPCPYYYLHEDKTELESDEVLDALAATFQSLKDREEQVANELVRVRQEIRQAMGDRTKIETSKVRISIFSVAGRTSFNEDQLKLDGIDPEKYKTKGEKSERMRITLKDDFATDE